MEKLRWAFAVEKAPLEQCAKLPPVLEDLARAVVDRGMDIPAIIFLDSMRPLSFLTGEVLWSAWPLVRLSGKWSGYREVAEALGDRNCLPMLIKRIEELQTMGKR